MKKILKDINNNDEFFVTAYTAFGGYMTTDGLTCSVYIISKENTYFVVDNGILYDSGRKKLICYPSSLSMQLLNIPESIVQIYSGAFYGWRIFFQFG